MAKIEKQEESFLEYLSNLEWFIGGSKVECN